MSAVELSSLVFAKRLPVVSFQLSPLFKTTSKKFTLEGLCETGNDLFTVNFFAFETKQISHFTVVYLVAKPLIWSEAESDLVGSPRLTML